MLAALSSARPKIADYPFTTLRPVLGVVTLGPQDNGDQRTFVLEDIPGLIEGASQGKGLGHEFLRHVERTRILVFLVDVTTEDPAAALATLEHELAEWSPELLEKPRLVVFSKADLLPPGEAAERARPFGALALSAATGQGLAELKEKIGAILDAERLREAT
jgi:GTP-binding protein